MASVDTPTAIDIPTVDGVAVDVVALTVLERQAHVLLVKRGREPFLGRWALPGVFLRPNSESLEDAAQRALISKANVVGHIEQLSSYGDSGRDPRGHIISVAYVAFLPETTSVERTEKTLDALWVPITTDVEPIVVRTPDGLDLAFDHELIVRDGIERARSKLEWTPLSTSFLSEPFTISDIRYVYEAIWGQSLDAGNFHRKSMTTPGFLVPYPGKRANAQLFTRGTAIILDPPLNRSSTVTRRKQAVGMA